MRMLQQPPSDRRYSEKSEAAADNQTLPAEPERRPQDDSDRDQSVQPVSCGGGAPKARGLMKPGERPKNSPDASEESVEPEEQPRFKGRQSAHCAGATATTADARRPKVKTSQTSTT